MGGFPFSVEPFIVFRSDVRMSASRAAASFQDKIWVAGGATGLEVAEKDSNVSKSQRRRQIEEMLWTSAQIAGAHIFAAACFSLTKVFPYQK